MARRNILALTMSAAAAWFAASALKAQTDCKKVGRNCDRNGDCCPGAECRGGECRCKDGREECNGECFHLDRDEDHCGACDSACSADETCCDGACTDLNADSDHCGSCENRCPGICSPNADPGGQQICHGPRCCSQGVCVDDVQSDPDHCGSCGNRCPGICSQQADGSVICHGPRCCHNGACVDTTTDAANCGGCGRACAVGLLSHCCNSTCVDLQHDNDHCGACGQACPNSQQCCNGEYVDTTADRTNCGACGNACADTWQCCNGVCSALDDVNNCGGCGYACPAGSDRCVFHAVCCFPGQELPRAPDCGELGCCDTQPQHPDAPAPSPCRDCTARQRCCDDACIDVESDRTNCGRCGRRCDGSSICLSGSCISCPPGRIVCGNSCCIA